MTARVDSDEPLAEGQRDLAELAVHQLNSKRMDRSHKADGEPVRAVIEQRARPTADRKVWRMIILQEVRALPAGKR
jgi:hypothetical protein